VREIHPSMCNLGNLSEPREEQNRRIKFAYDTTKYRSLHLQNGDAADLVCLEDQFKGRLNVAGRVCLSCDVAEGR